MAKKKEFNWSIVWSVLLGFLLGLGVGYAVWAYTVPEVEAGSRHTEWRLTQEGEWGPCRPVDESCDQARGEQWKTNTYTCTRIDGRGSDECRIVKQCPDGYQPSKIRPDKCFKLKPRLTYVDYNYIPETKQESESRACRVEEPKQCSTALVCLDGENELTIPRTQEAWDRVLYSWPDAYVGECKIPDAPPPTTLPEVSHHTSMPGAPPGRCAGQSDPVIIQAVATRNGTSANIAYVPTTGEGELVNVVYDENPFEIIFGLGSHALRDWTPNNGNVQLNDLVAGQSYWFRIANGCSPWSSIFFIQ